MTTLDHAEAARHVGEESRGIGDHVHRGDPEIGDIGHRGERLVETGRHQREVQGPMTTWAIAIGNAGSFSDQVRNVSERCTKAASAR